MVNIYRRALRLVKLPRLKQGLKAGGYIHRHISHVEIIVSVVDCNLGLSIDRTKSPIQSVGHVDRLDLLPVLILVHIILNFKHRALALRVGKGRLYVATVRQTVVVRDRAIAHFLDFSIVPIHGYFSGGDVVVALLRRILARQREGESVALLHSRLLADRSRVLKREGIASILPVRIMPDYKHVLSHGTLNGFRHARFDKKRVIDLGNLDGHLLVEDGRVAAGVGPAERHRLDVVVNEVGSIRELNALNILGIDSNLLPVVSNGIAIDINTAEKVANLKVESKQKEHASNAAWVIINLELHLLGIRRGLNEVSIIRLLSREIAAEYNLGSNEFIHLKIKLLLNLGELDISGLGSIRRHCADGFNQGTLPVENVGERNLGSDDGRNHRISVGGIIRGLEIRLFTEFNRIA